METEKHIWSREKTEALISIYRDHIEEFRNPYKRQKVLWENLAYKMKICGFENVTGNNCDRKWRNLKGTFKKIYYDNERTQESKSQWDFYNELVVLFTSDYRKEMGVERKSRTLQPALENEAFENYEELSENEEYLDEYLEIGEIPVENENETELELEEEYLNEEELEVNEENDENFHIQYNEEVATTTADESVKEIIEEVEEEVPVPNWFKSFMTRYDKDQSDLKTSMNNILETETQQMKLMMEISEKLDKRKCDCECIEQSIDYQFLPKKRKI